MIFYNKTIFSNNYYVSFDSSKFVITKVGFELDSSQLNFNEGSMYVQTSRTYPKIKTFGLLAREVSNYILDTFYHYDNIGNLNVYNPSLYYIKIVLVVDSLVPDGIVKKKYR